MKKLLLVFALCAGVTVATNVAQAQIKVNINIGSQPLWGPTGYDNAQYYYLPDVNAYYNVSNQQFIYQERGNWVFRSSLPGQYRNFDLYSGYKVVINERDPWLRDRTYATKYRSYKGRRGQAVIRDSRDNRYYENPNNPHHNEWRGGRGVDQKQVDRRNQQSNNRNGNNRGDVRHEENKSQGGRGDMKH